MDKPKIIIGIDPDVDKSGVACLNVEKFQVVRVDALSITQLIRYFSNAYDRVAAGIYNKGDIAVVIEDSDSRTNWQIKDMRISPRAAAAIGHGAGMCHATQRHIQEIAESYEAFNIVLQHPLKKSWMGRDGKITQEEITQFIPGLPNKMNQECRDACLLAWSYANFPIHIPASFYIEALKKKKGE